MRKRLHSFEGIPAQAITVQPVVDRAGGDIGIVAEPRGSNDEGDQENHRAGIGRNTPSTVNPHGVIDLANRSREILRARDQESFFTHMLRTDTFVVASISMPNNPA